MPAYFEFEVSLDGVKPKIWRRFLLRDAAAFWDLHCAIQDACGWNYSHLFVFREPGRRGDDIAGMPLEDEPMIPSDEPPAPAAKKVKLSAYFGPGKQKACAYEYDFGDSWEHTVKLRKVVDLPEKFKRRLLAGARAFPLDDCGSIPGYYNCIEVLKGGEDPDGLKEWMGKWDPEAFDLEEMKKTFDG